MQTASTTRGVKLVKHLGIYDGYDGEQSTAVCTVQQRFHLMCAVWRWETAGCVFLDILDISGALACARVQLSRQFSGAVLCPRAPQDVYCMLRRPVQAMRMTRHLEGHLDLEI
jgi:hypothetical protein